MKALALTPGTTKVRLADWPEPKIEKPDDIKVQVLSVGICGTDREETHGGRADPPPGEKELVIGHEMVSRVIETGPAVKNFKKGDLLVFTVRRGCNACPACKILRYDMCLTGNYTERGIKGRHGYEAQYVVDQEMYAIKVPSSVAHLAVLTEPMSVVEKAIDIGGLIQKARLPYLKDNWLQGKVALIAGLGPIGLLAAMILSLRGATILGLDIVDPSSPRAKIFTAFGGKYFNDKQCDLKAFPLIDIIIDAAGIAKLDFDLMSVLGINGIFILTGVPGDQRLDEVDGARLMRQMVLKNQAMVGSVNASFAHFQKGIEDFQAADKKWPGVVEKLITQRFPYTEFNTPLTKHSPDEIKVVIDWSK